MATVALQSSCVPRGEAQEMAPGADTDSGAPSPSFGEGVAYEAVDATSSKRGRSSSGISSRGDAWASSNASS